MTLQEQLRVYWDRQPCGFLHSSKQPGTPEYFADLDEWRTWVQPHIRQFSGCSFGSPSVAGKRILDAGCGLGSDSRMFTRAGAKVTAVDNSLYTLSLLKGSQFSVRHVDLDGTRIIAISRYDLIWCWGVLHHLTSPEQALQNLRRVAHEETILKLMVYNRYSWKAFRVWLGIDQPEAQAGCPLARTYTKRGITKLLSENGWQVQSIQVEHIFPWKIGPYKEHRLEKAWYWSMVPDRLFHWLEHRIGWHLCVTARPI